MGWILETNEPMNRAMEGMGGKVVKRYRLYEGRCRRLARELPGSAQAAGSSKRAWAVARVARVSESS